MSFIVLRQVRLGANHQATGNTSHYRGGRPVPAPSVLQIVHYPDGTGYYLIHLDEHDQELTDTFHDTIADAVRQAEWEFRVQPSEWQVVGPVSG